MIIYYRYFSKQTAIHEEFHM